jgi:hypothetical protein
MKAPAWIRQPSALKLIVMLAQLAFMPVAQSTEPKIDPDFKFAKPFWPTLETTPLIEWEFLSRAHHYDMQVSESKDCSKPLAKQSYTDIKDSRFRLTERLPVGKYFLCLLGYRKAKSGTMTKFVPTNNGFPLEITKLGAFKVLQPAQPKQVFNTGLPLLKWGYSSGAASYAISISKNADCSEGVRLPSALPSVEFTAPKLTNGNYFFCVTAMDMNGFKRPADNSPIPFTVDTTQGTNRMLASEPKADPLTLK